MSITNLIRMASLCAVPVIDNGVHHDYRTGIGHKARKKKKAKRRQQKQSRRNK